jgi:hypothetical protein
MLYSKNGSYPQATPDHDEEGWDEIIDKPEPAPEGMEVVWNYPPGWVVRIPEPAAIPGAVWKWEQMTGRWVCYNEEGRVNHIDAANPSDQMVSLITDPVPTINFVDLQTSQLSAL